MNEATLHSGRSRFHQILLILLTLLMLNARADTEAQPTAQISDGQVIDGPARFTVLTPLCIRMEYAPAYGFVDNPTLFANNRTARLTTAKVSTDQNLLRIDTGKIRLEYRPDGKPFNAKNLHVYVKTGSQEIAWDPGMKNSANLGGPIPTLDGQSGPFKLPDGLLSRSGWYLWMIRGGRCSRMAGSRSAPARECSPDRFDPALLSRPGGKDRNFPGL